MKSPRARAVVVLAALAAVIGSFVVISGGDDDGGGDSAPTTTQAQTQTSATTETTPTQEEAEVSADEQITVRNGKPAGGVKELSYKTGDRIRFVVTSDVADEVHVHGYDVSKEVPAGGSVRFGFPAKLEGVFEVELEQRGEQIAELRVSP